MESEIDWDVLLPNYPWKQLGKKSWEDIMPPPRRQLSHLLPKDFMGSCGVHAYSETLTALLRRVYGTSDIAVDLPRLLHLTANGSSMDGMKRLAMRYGIPLEAPIPEHLANQRSYHLLDPQGDAYALDTTVISYKANPLPFTYPTAAEAKKAIRYREFLCTLLNIGPVVLTYELQTHYDKRRPEGEPYRRVQDGEYYVMAPPKRWFSFAKPEPVRESHSVTAYGYDCPGGDVRTLDVLFQENMRGAPDEEPGRLVIHPDAIGSFSLVYVADMVLSNEPDEMEVVQETETSWLKKIATYFS